MAGDSAERPSPDGSLRRALLVTTGLIGLTMLLGVTTRAMGAGLACDANWPLCDGGVLNLLPATVPSAIEWIHRVVAGMTGLVMASVVVLAWRRSADRVIRAAVTAGLLLLPLQILLGRETVLTFTPPILAAHYWSAMTIFGCYGIALAQSYRGRIGSRGLRWLSVLALGGVVGEVLLSPPQVLGYSPSIQALHYVTILLGLGSLLTLAWVGRYGRPRPPAYASTVLATAGFPLVVFLGRQRIVHPFTAIEPLHELATGLVLLALLVATIGLWRRPTGN